MRQAARRMSYPVNGPRHLAEVQRRQTLGLRFVPLQVAAEQLTGKDDPVKLREIDFSSV